MNNLILASSSPFRKNLLERLQKPFECDSPDINESRHAGELPETYVKRLSLEKARTVAPRHQNNLIIASDQCSLLGNAISGKPLNRQTAIKQLQKSSGQRVSFFTGLCVLNSSNGKYLLDMVPYYVDFRELSLPEIERYLDAEQPYNCAGSFMAEGLGITLFKKLEGDDPSALIGLPLIRLCEMLREFELKLP